jgi:hypothetical protein
MDLPTAQQWWRGLFDSQRAFVLAVLTGDPAPAPKGPSDAFVFYAYRARHWPAQEGWPKR